MADDEQIRRFTFERGQLKSKLTKFINFFDKITDFTSERISELENRLYNIQDIINKFDLIQSQLEYLDPDELNDTERDNFENKYFSIITKVKNVIKYHTEENHRQNSLGHSLQTNQSQTNLVNNSNSVKLPTLELPKFNGNVDKWPQFRDLFLTIVHNDPVMDNVRKFYYLSSCLVGEAQKVIHSIEITNDNYSVAWDLLKNRFDNKDLTIKKHINAILDLPRINKSAYTLRNLTDDVQTRIRSLKVLGEPVEHWNSILVQILVRKLDDKTEALWDEHVISTKKSGPKVDELLSFLSDRCSLYEAKDIRNDHSNTSYNVQKYDNNYFNKHINKKQHFPKSSSHVATYMSKCPHCKQDHKLYSCKNFLSLSVSARIPIVKRLGLCNNCLRANHVLNECVSQGCKICGKKHNTVLHLDTTENRISSNNLVSVQVENNSGNQLENASQVTGVSSIVHHSTSRNQIILSTAIILIQTRDGGWQKCRALLDNGSQSNFVTENIAKMLQLPIFDVHVPITGVGSTNAFTSKKIVANIRSGCSNFSAKLSFLILKRITESLPTFSFDTSEISFPKNIVFADSEFNISSPIDVLLGAEIFYHLLRSGHIKLGDDKNFPILQKTVLGWVVSGPLSSSQEHMVTCCNFALTKPDPLLDGQLEKFWTLEECIIKKYHSQEEEECEIIFNSSVALDSSNHFIVNLPIKSNHNRLGNSLQNAIKRLYSVERKFKNNPGFKDQYINFMAEYEQLGHMSQIKNVQNDTVTQNVFYLPHHGVINNNSTTTKLRVVFDGSCRSDTGVALNDILMVGPTLQDDVFEILLRFRRHYYVLTADIEKMYRQINVAEHQRDLQRIVWRSDPSQPISHYRLNTITYGTASASFIAVRCLQQIAFENMQVYPEICQIIMSDFYVDDLITGTDSIEKACQIKSQIFDLLKKYGFVLRKWLSNETEIIRENDHDHSDDYHIIDQETNKTLGLRWQASLDVLRYMVGEIELIQNNVTKRTILSSISKIFDPLGLISPIVIRAKIMIQQLWLAKVGWDEILPHEFQTKWTNFRKQLLEINNIQIPRCILAKSIDFIEVHCFSDASLSAYGACVYVKSIINNKPAEVKLLCSKTRVAPVKTVTLPRLELCGALLAIQLYTRVINALKIQVHSAHFWTDSTIVLAWLSSPPGTWKIFVSNRVSDILGISRREQWRHVPSKENPADILSRGATVAELEFSNLWWFGPHWLSMDNDSWPKQPDIGQEVTERRQNISVNHFVVTSNIIFSRFSSFIKMKRVLALCFRFFNNCRKGSQKVRGKLSIEEIDKTTVALVRLAQRESFPAELLCLKQLKPISKGSRLVSLSPFLDPDGLIRVGGRLLNAKIAYGQKFPILLHPKHILTKLLILNEHHRHLHVGTQSVLASLRQQYWVINGRMTVRSILRKCVTCFRVKPIAAIQKMSNLPANRVSPKRPFYITGIDIAGPFLIRDGKLRNRKIIKAYLCLFVCFTTRAVHLEPISDMTSETFLNALKRFTSRRGFCKYIYSDNGTNFVGANNELKNVVQTMREFPNNKAFSDYFTEHKIRWNFIPAQSPHHGGLWEAAIKQAKIIIIKILRCHHPTFEELATIFSQVEAILNSRPLTPLSSDPNDFEPLTPGHFLIGDSLISIPQFDLSQLPTNRLNQYQTLQQATQHFWSRWSREYLALLQQRTKWTQIADNKLKTGSMVLIAEENLPPLKWKTGRILELHPGQDGLIRVVTLQTTSGITKRAIQKVCPLPIEEQC